jgi:hypothetical protein
MSTKLIIQTEIRNMAILKGTLEEMGLNFTAENEDVVRIQAAYPISINLQNGNIDYDSDQKNQVQGLIQQYAANFMKDEYIREGSSIVSQEVDQQGRIHIITG